MLGEQGTQHRGGSGPVSKPTEQLCHRVSMRPSIRYVFVMEGRMESIKLMKNSTVKYVLDSFSSKCRDNYIGS